MDDDYYIPERTRVGPASIPGVLEFERQHCPDCDITTGNFDLEDCPGCGLSFPVVLVTTLGLFQPSAPVSWS